MFAAYHVFFYETTKRYYNGAIKLALSRLFGQQLNVWAQGFYYTGS